MLKWPTVAIGLAASVAIGGIAMDARAEAPQQAQATAAQPVETPSLDRIRRQLDREPGLEIEFQVPVPTFHVTVEERRYMLTFDEWLHKEFDLNPFQKKWLEHYAKGVLFTPTGVDLLQVHDRWKRFSRQLESRKARREVARELQRFNEAKSAEDRLLPPDAKQLRYSR